MNSRGRPGTSAAIERLSPRFVTSLREILPDQREFRGPVRERDARIQQSVRGPFARQVGGIAGAEAAPDVGEVDPLAAFHEFVIGSVYGVRRYRSSRALKTGDPTACADSPFSVIFASW